MNSPAPPIVATFPSKQARLDELLEQNSSGNLSDAGRGELESLVNEAEALAISNGRRLAEFAHGQAPALLPGAVPVTVWVVPQATER